MRDFMTLGPSPCGEDCVQLGTEDYPEKSRAECKRYKKLLEEKFPLNGIYFGIKSFDHDFGTYREVVVYYDDNDEESADNALTVENNLPETWEDTRVYTEQTVPVLKKGMYDK